MKLNLNRIIPLLSFIILKSNAQFQNSPSSQIYSPTQSGNNNQSINSAPASNNIPVVNNNSLNNGPIQSNTPLTNTNTTPQIEISDKELENFSYGDKEYKLAVVGDTGAEKESKDIMSLRDFDALLHLGDYDYRCLPDDYFTKVLDSNRKYQFMGIVGNHDTESQCNAEEARQYVDNIYKEMDNPKNKGLQCEFSPSKFMWVCVHDNVRIIGLTPDIRGADEREEQLAFLKKHLQNAKEDWKICSWHYYDKYYHTGRYQSPYNLVSGEGESFYDYCKEHGAIIFSAHDHVYARTRVMSQFSEPVIDQYDGVENGKVVQIRPGATLNILNGVGGFYIYIEQGEQMLYEHWQKKYARGKNDINKDKFGGLFCTFNYKGNNKKAFCELVRLNDDNKVFDSFYIYRNSYPATTSYNDIDMAFREEKLNAYIVANHLNIDGGGGDDDVNNNEEPTTIIDDNTMTSDNNSSLTPNIATSSDNIIIDSPQNEDQGNIITNNKYLVGGSLAGAFAVVGALLLYRHKRRHSVPEGLREDIGPIRVTVPNLGAYGYNGNGSVNQDGVYIPPQINYNNQYFSTHPKGY